MSESIRSNRWRVAPTGPGAHASRGDARLAGDLLGRAALAAIVAAASACSGQIGAPPASVDDGRTADTGVVADRLDAQLDDGAVPDAGFAVDAGNPDTGEGPVDGGVGVVFSTFLNPEVNAGYSELWEAVVDGNGDIIVAGLGLFADPRVGSPYGSVPTHVYDETGQFEGSSLMVVKLSPDGQPRWFAFLDSSGDEKELDGVAVNSLGEVYVSGTVVVADFPTTAGAFDTTINNAGVVNRNGDAVVAKLSADGSTLLFSTFLGSADGDSTSRGGLAVAADNGVYVSGQTKAATFLSNPSSGDAVPVRNAFAGGVADGFVLKLSADGSDVEWVTYVGSAEEAQFGDVVLSVAVGPNGKPHLSALVRGPGALTATGVHQQTYAGGLSDAYVARLGTDGEFEWGTYLGGSGEDGPEHGLRVTAGGEAVLVGFTTSTDWPTQLPAQTALSGPSDGFLTKVDATGQLVFSTYVGGDGSDVATGVGIDAEGRIVVGGNTSPPGLLATPGAIDETANGDVDVFARVYADDGALVYSTIFGGQAWDRCRFGTTAANGDILLVGSTQSTDFPTVRAFKNTHNGGYDVYVSRLAW